MTIKPNLVNRALSFNAKKLEAIYILQCRHIGCSIWKIVEMVKVVLAVWLIY